MRNYGDKHVASGVARGGDPRPREDLYSSGASYHCNFLSSTCGQNVRSLNFPLRFSKSNWQRNEQIAPHTRDTTLGFQKYIETMKTERYWREGLWLYESCLFAQSEFEVECDMYVCLFAWATYPRSVNIDSSTHRKKNIFTFFVPHRKNLYTAFFSPRTWFASFAGTNSLRANKTTLGLTKL